MWIIQEPNTLELWNKLHFEDKRRKVYNTMFKIFSTCTEWPKKMYTLFTHQYLWNKFKWNFYLWGSLKVDVYRRKPATLDDLRESIAMSCAAITLDTLQNVVHAAVRRIRHCLDADGGHFEHLHWIQNSRTFLISILLLYKYSSYDCRVIFFMSKCAYIFWATLYLLNKYIKCNV